MELEQALDEVFSGKQEESPAAPPEAPQAPEEQPVIPVEAPQEPVEAPAAPQPEQPKEDHSVPLRTYLDTRDELKELRRWKQEQEAKAQAPKAPDPFDDPQGFAAHQEQQFQARLTQQKFEMSDVMARQAHGPDTVEAASNWAMERAQKDPVFAAQYMREPHPIDWIVRQHKRDSLVSNLPEDVSSLDELIEREIAKRGLNAAPAAPAAIHQPAPKPAAPTPSLVNAPSGGGLAEVATGKLAALDAVFPR